MTYRVLVRVEAQEPTEWIADDTREVAVDLSPAQAEHLRDSLVRAGNDLARAMFLGWDTPKVAP